jgi:di/tripeptidase
MNESVFSLLEPRPVWAHFATLCAIPHEAVISEHLLAWTCSPSARTSAAAHAPGERVDIASVGRCWVLLKALLAALAEPATVQDQ